MSEKSTIFKQHLFKKNHMNFFLNFHHGIFSLYSTGGGGGWGGGRVGGVGGLGWT